MQQQHAILSSVIYAKDFKCEWMSPQFLWAMACIAQMGIRGHHFSMALVYR